MKNPFSLENKTILITGVSSGIGKATAILCAQMGAKLIITGRTESKLDEVFKLLNGERHQKLVLDFEDAHSVETLIQSVEQLDGVVFSAGILDSTPLKFVNSEKLSKMMKINFEIPFQTTQLLAKKKKLNKDASLVFVSSLAGIGMVSIGLSAYSASKGAISAVIKVMALELAPQKIRVNAICPGMVRTEMLVDNSIISEEQLSHDEKINYPLGYGTPEQVASSIAFLLSEGSSWITGTNMVIDGGASIH